MTLKHSSTPVSSLESIIITSHLKDRPSRRIDFETENVAFCELAQHYARNPREFPGALTSLALNLCNADTVGINIKEIHNSVTGFRWVAVAGELKQMVGTVTPDGFTPCETCLETQRPLLIANLDRLYPELRLATLPFVEALLVPWGLGTGTHGTLWAVTHNDHRKFDQEDVRLMSSFAAFGAGALSLEDSLRQSQRSLAAAHIAASMAHHINNPLQGALLALHQARSKCDSHELLELILIAELFLGRVKALSAELIRDHAWTRRSDDPK